MHLQSGGGPDPPAQNGLRSFSFFPRTSVSWLDLCLCPSGLLQEMYQAKQEGGKDVMFETGKSHV